MRFQAVHRTSCRHGHYYVLPLPFPMVDSFFFRRFVFSNPQLPLQLYFHAQLRWSEWFRCRASICSSSSCGNEAQQCRNVAGPVKTHVAHRRSTGSVGPSSTTIRRTSASDDSNAGTYKAPRRAYSTICYRGYKSSEEVLLPKP